MSMKLHSIFDTPFLSSWWWKQRRRRARRMRSGKCLAKKWKKKPSQFDPDRPLTIIGDTVAYNGLSRAYRYEVNRMAHCESVPYHVGSDQVLILAQPWDYPRLLSDAPSWFANAYRIGLWVWELQQFPRDWEFALEIVHEIWTPSSFSAEALRLGTDLPIKIVPHLVDPKRVSPLPRIRFGVSDEQFLGMAIMNLDTCPDRKNAVAHVLAWRAAFGNDTSMHLLMKLRFKKSTLFARNELLEAIAGAQNISIVEETFTDDDMVAFQRMADVYISLHRAEGYGLNIHEMLEIGTPTIATGWSGNMDYMPRYSHAYPIPYRLVPYNDRTYAYDGKGLQWAEPDIDVAAKTLRQVYKRWLDESDNRHNPTQISPNFRERPQ